jgi:hypothetical protein
MAPTIFKLNLPQLKLPLGQNIKAALQNDITKVKTVNQKIDDNINAGIKQTGVAIQKGVDTTKANIQKGIDNVNADVNAYKAGFQSSFDAAGGNDTGSSTGALFASGGVLVLGLAVVVGGYFFLFR